MNGGLLQGLRVWLKGVVCEITRTTDSESSCLVWTTQSLSTILWDSGGGSLMEGGTSGGNFLWSRIVWRRVVAQQSHHNFHSLLTIYPPQRRHCCRQSQGHLSTGLDFESIRPDNRDFESVALVFLRFRLWVGRVQYHFQLLPVLCYLSFLALKGIHGYHCEALNSYVGGYFISFTFWI
jgi:hypothetical protein